MKFNFRSIIASVSLFFLSSIHFPINAHSSERTLGLAGGFAAYNHGGMASVYFHAPLMPHMRIAPEIGYVFRNKEKSGFECAVDFHFPFRITRGVNIYPLTGLTINNWSFKHAKHSSHAGLDFGGGFDICMTPSLKLNVQIKYSMMKNTAGTFAQIGAGYNF